MIDGGGKIGGPPGTPPPAAQPGQDAAKTAKDTPAAKQAPADSFVKTEGKAAQQKLGGAAVLRGEGSGSTDVLRLARDNPAAARQLVATLASQSAATLSQIEQALAGVRAMLEKLAAERFAKAAHKEVGDRLRREREKLKALKLRLAMGLRKMALLQQVAGKLGDPRVDEEIDRILNHHNKLKSGWGKRHHLLSIGSSLFGADEDAPEYLKQVIKAEIRSGTRGNEAGDAMRAVSPRAVIAEIIARTIDGSEREEPSEKAPVQRGEYGRSMQSYALLAELLEGSMVDDPFGEES